MRSFALLIASVSLLGAQQGGYISGTIRDRSGGIVAAAEVRVQSQETGARQIIFGDIQGRYLTNELAPGSYRITVRRKGFVTVLKPDISVIVSKVVHVDFAISVLPLQQEVTVSAVVSEVDPTASGLKVSRDGPSATLPQNGRDVHALFAIMPGATLTPASISGGGQFTVSGLRPNANSFRVDGIDANVGLGSVSTAGAFPGGALPGMTAIGSMQNLAGKEETDRIELQSTDFDAKFGDHPGAQITIDTRAGSNEFHGSAFGYIRPHLLDSRDWFARGAGVDLPNASVNGFGGSVSGPLWRRHTFFFASFERAALHDSALQVIAVPSFAARANPLLQPYQTLFDAFPAPTGRALSVNESLGYSPLRKDGAVTNRNARIDQIISNHLQGFVRYSDVPSSATSIELGSSYSALHWMTLTCGMNLVTEKVTQELRLNFTKSQSISNNNPQNTPAVNALNDAVVGDLRLPGQITQVSMTGVGGTVSGASGAGYERQWEGNYMVYRHAGKHSLRAGVDYSKFDSGNFAYSVAAVGSAISPGFSGPILFSEATQITSIVSPGVEDLLAGVPLGFTESSGAPALFAGERYSSFVEDTVRFNERLNILFGLRWDITPPYATDAEASLGLLRVGYWQGSGAQPVQIPNNNSVWQNADWPSHYGQLAPRFGVAYHLKSPDLVLRAGAGLFYDTSLGSMIANTTVFNIWQLLPSVDVSATAGGTVPRPAASALSLPRVWEWKASIEKPLGEQSLFSASYFGSVGSKLLRTEATVDPQSGLLGSLQFASHGTSNYNALLTNLRLNATPNLFALISYSWAHSIDTGSSETALFLVGGSSNKGSSSFDVRHLLTASLRYRIPDRSGSVFSGWSLSFTSSVRTGFPFNVTTVDRSIGLGFDNVDYASLISGQPIWLSNPGVAGGRSLNASAFQLPASGAAGTLGRNALVGPGLVQTDLSLRRQFRLYRGSSVEVAVSAFNLLNHPAFANPIGYLGSALFGQSTSMTDLMLGAGSPTTGLTPLFQAGGPRTVELSLRFSF